MNIFLIFTFDQSRRVIMFAFGRHYFVVVRKQTGFATVGALRGTTPSRPVTPRRRSVISIPV